MAETPGKGSGTASVAASHSTVTTASSRNRAGDSQSPYVRAHADTLVQWQLLDDEAVQRAKAENKLIFMNIGFSACHFCRLTRQDSFSNPAVTDLLNKYFIPIIVDREERPEINAVYWNYIQTVQSDAGWPINIFLTPELEPVFGGTYWPGPGAEASASDTGGAEDERFSFEGILEKLRDSWAEREVQCRNEATDTLQKLRKFAAEGTLVPSGLSRPAPVPAQSGDGSSDSPGDLKDDLDLDLEQLEEAYSQLSSTFDPINGGFGFAPKFITPAKFTFLLRLAKFPAAVRHIVGYSEVENATHMAFHTLRRLRDGGLHDHLGAGFARLSVTEDWSLPQFEKLVPDNALLLVLYLDAWLCNCNAADKPANDHEFLDVVFELANYLTSAPILRKDGGFASSEAADSFHRKGDKHTRQGAYYLWTRREFETALAAGDGSDQHAISVAAAFFNVSAHGNIERDNDPNDEFINQNVLRVTETTTELARQFGTTEVEVRETINAAKVKLRTYREKERVRPEVDDKVVAGYNGIAIGALARTGAALIRSGVDAESGRRYLDAARGAARLVQEKMWDGQYIYRIFNDARGDTKAFAEDYAFLIEGLLELYEACGEESWLQWSDELQKRQIELFYDMPRSSNAASGEHQTNGAFYSTTANSPHTILRLKDGMDTTQTSVNGVSVSNLFRLGSILSDDAYMHLARETIHAFEVEMLQHPWLFPSLLSGVVTARLGGKTFLVTNSSQGVPDTATSSSGAQHPPGSSASEQKESPTVTRFFTRPRAGSRSLIQVSSTGNSWLKTRNPALGSFLSKDKEQGGYFLDKGSWRRTTEKDMPLEEEDV